MTTPNKSEVVFLLDVDNTLLDNDSLAADLRQHLLEEFGQEREKHYWTLFEELRSELGYADYLGALQRYRLNYMEDPNLLTMSAYLLDYPFANRLFPQALEVIKHLQKWGPTVILSDGDVIFQPRKIARSGLWEAVKGNVLIYIHKEEQLESVERHFPAQHYVLVDDKLRILSTIKASWHERLTTVFPRQGHYAHDSKLSATFPAADITIERIGELLNYDLSALLSV